MVKIEGKSPKPFTNWTCNRKTNRTKLRGQLRRMMKSRWWKQHGPMTFFICDPSCLWSAPSPDCFAPCSSLSVLLHLLQQISLTALCRNRWVASQSWSLFLQWDSKGLFKRLHIRCQIIMSNLLIAILHINMNIYSIFKGIWGQSFSYLEVTGRGDGGVRYNQLV